MNKEVTKDRIKVMQAYVDGKPIEKFDYRTLTWDDVIEPKWHWYEQYRIKPEAQLRPYKSAEEFLQAQKEHGLYVLLANLGRNEYALPSSVGDEMIEVCEVSYSYKDCLESLRWQDGHKCGVMEE